MTQTDLQPAMGTFSGLKRDWKTYNQRIREACIAASSDLWGLLGFLIGAVAFLALTGNAFAPTLDPGADPVAGNPAPNAAALGLWNIWKFNVELFNTQQRNLKAFRTAFINSLDETTRESMEEPGFGLQNRTLQWLYEEATRLHGTLTASDLAENELLLDVSYNPSQPLRAFIRVQIQSHTIAATNNQPLSEAAKVRRFKASLSTCGLFKTCIELFEHDLPGVAQQTFLLLAARVQEYDDNRPRNATADNTLSAAAATATTPPSPCVCDCPTCTANTAAAAVLAAAAVGGHKSGRVPVPSPHSGPLYYCWTHGPCGHTSAECQNPREGHIKSATLRNPQGGKLTRGRGRDNKK